jgi:hypothetical protein
VPLDREPVGKAQLLELEILPASSISSDEGHELPVVAHQHAKEIGHVESAVSACFGSPRTRDSTAIDAVEQEMRANPGLQRLQARLGDGRRKRLRASAK